MGYRVHSKMIPRNFLYEKLIAFAKRNNIKNIFTFLLFWAWKQINFCRLCFYLSYETLRFEICQEMYAWDEFESPPESRKNSWSHLVAHLVVLGGNLIVYVKKTLVFFFAFESISLTYYTTRLKVNSVQEREPSQPILTSIISILFYFDDGFMIHWFIIKAIKSYQNKENLIYFYYIWKNIEN